uniref:Uncharacterized protein n=1 Tax=Davidia involucrata TaxID=16924 RepID=A0A5B6YSF1_DAVIN
MPINKESMPPPVIGKIGPYTVFVTPPATPRPTEPVAALPRKVVPVQQPGPVQEPPPPVQPPPQQFHKPTSARSPSNDSMFGFFWDAVAKVQNAHSSLDEYVAHWFGLNQSKYQWALDDYYESKGMDEVDARAKDKSSKIQSV